MERFRETDKIDAESKENVELTFEKSNEKFEHVKVGGSRLGGCWLGGSRDSSGTPTQTGRFAVRC
jgi:hypothetical protein